MTYTKTPVIVIDVKCSFPRSNLHFPTCQGFLSSWWFQPRCFLKYESNWIISQTLGLSKSTKKIFETNFVLNFVGPHDAGKKSLKPPSSSGESNYFPILPVFSSEIFLKLQRPWNSNPRHRCHQCQNANAHLETNDSLYC